MRGYIGFGGMQAQNYVSPIASFNDVDVVCLRGHWTPKITQLGIAGRVVYMQSLGGVHLE